MEFEDNLNSMINSLYMGTDSKEEVGDRIKLIQTKLTEGITGNYITSEKYSNFMERLTPYINDVLSKTTKDIRPRTWLAFKDNSLEKEINKVLEKSNIKDEPKNKSDKEKYYFIRNTIQNNYIKSIKKQFQDIKQKSINNEYKDVNNWIDFQEVVDNDIRKKLHNKAIKDALIDYAQNELNIRLTGEETTNDIIESIHSTENKNTMNELKNKIADIQYKIIN